MTTSPDLEQLARGLTEAQRAAVCRAALMVSGGHRLPFTTGSANFDALEDLDVVAGTYLTPLGLALRDHLRKQS